MISKVDMEIGAGVILFRQVSVTSVYNSLYNIWVRRPNNHQIRLYYTRIIMISIHTRVRQRSTTYIYIYHIECMIYIYIYVYCIHYDVLRNCFT